MENSKWIATVASIWIQCSCGASYAFGIYSSALKSSQGYDQSTLDTVSVFKDIGANVGVISGLLYSAVAANYGRSSCFGSGPWVVHVAGALQIFTGYFLMWLSVTGVIDRPHVLLMCLFMFMAAHAQTFFNTANVVVAVQNFPDYGGTIVGIMKGFLGLSGAILIQMYHTLINDKPSTFLLMLAVFPTLVSLTLMCLVRVHQSNTIDDKRHLDGFSLLALATAIYLMIIIIFENIFTFPLWAHIVTCTVLLFLVSSPLKIAITAQRQESQRSSSTTKTPLIVHPQPEKLSASESPNEEASIASSEELTGKEMNLFQAMGTMNFWLLFVAMICGMGSGLATINNISQIGESLNYSTVEVSALVSLWSIWNFLGRFGGGYISYLFLHRQGWGRPLFIALTQAAMTAGHLIIASGFRGNLYVGSIIVGICYGSQWSLMPTITSEIFGLKHMGTIFNVIAAANPVGSYIFSVRVIGYIYDRNTSTEGDSCHGTRCFMLSFFIFAAVSLFGFCISLILFFRTRRFYMLILHKRVNRLAGQ